MIRTLLTSLAFASGILLHAAEYKVASPDGKVQAQIVCDNGTRYSLSFNGKELIVGSPVSMTLSDGTVWGNAKVRKASSRSLSSCAE